MVTTRVKVQVSKSKANECNSFTELKARFYKSSWSDFVPQKRSNYAHIETFGSVAQGLRLNPSM